MLHDSFAGEQPLARLSAFGYPFLFPHKLFPFNLTHMPTIKELLTEARSTLKGPEAWQESELLMEAICGIERSRQFSHASDELAEEQVERFKDAMRRRIGGEPVAYIIGRRGFWDMELKVTRDVLIPRPDTECLVEQALERIPEDVSWQIADLGTGSGAIALAIARERPNCEITATDNSTAALVVARENAAVMGLENIRFVTGSWGQALQNQRFNMVISNPPYIRTDDPHLNQGDLSAEPQNALLSGTDGLDDIRQIIADSVLHLNPAGWLLLEHGYEQAAAVSNMLQLADFNKIFTKMDYGGNDRVSGGRRHT